MINTKRLMIVPLEEKHLEILRKLRDDPTTWHWLTDVTPISEIGQRDWFEKVCRNKVKMYLAIQERTGFQIFVGILRSDEWDRVNRSIRIGIDIVPKFRGKGYGTEAFEAFIDYLFKQQNIHRIWFLVAEPNKIAQKLYEKLGFKEEGRQRQALFRDGKYWDYINMSILEDEWSFDKLRIKK